MVYLCVPSRAGAGVGCTVQPGCVVLLSGMCGACMVRIESILPFLTESCSYVGFMVRIVRVPHGYVHRRIGIQVDMLT
jgi:hypothetical protein